MGSDGSAVVVGGHETGGQGYEPGAVQSVVKVGSIRNGLGVKVAAGIFQDRVVPEGVEAALAILKGA